MGRKQLRAACKVLHRPTAFDGFKMPDAGNRNRRISQLAHGGLSGMADISGRWSNATGTDHTCGNRYAIVATVGFNDTTKACDRQTSMAQPMQTARSPRKLPVCVLDSWRLPIGEDDLLGEERQDHSHHGMSGIALNHLRER